MKNIIIAGLLLFTLATACRKQDDTSIFGEKPEERMNKQLAEYKTQLTTGANGWKAYVYPEGGAGFGFYFKFTDNNRVSMLGDLLPNTATDLKESSYRLAAQQRPSLVFDTYNYLHMLSDPDENIYGGLRGRGYDSDFEFGYDSTHNDTIFLTGNYNQSKMIMIKAAAPEESSYKAGALNDIQQKLDAYNNRYNTLYLKTADNKQVQLSIDANFREFSQVYLDSGMFKTKTYPYAHSIKGIFFKEPVTIDAYTFQELIYDDAKDVLYLKSGNNTVNILTSNVPVFPMHLLMGISFKQIFTSDATSVAFSPSYKTMWNDAKAALAAEPYTYPLTLEDLTIMFDINTNQMTFTFRFTQLGNSFPAPFIFDYTKTDDGTYTFAMQRVQGQLSEIMYPSAATILNKINTEKFKLDYFTAPGAGKMGQLISIDDPQFAIGGTLK
ncbi:DUF4302 domain-containing protein [Chitinophaga sp. MM2321]|uniref:DUF4302 domain-containing protein n=1 Tax=Chitinophaga sp. MM2321 TaxID=3137178 RepID=UPI0032D5A712